jgi:hypothetical protein
MKIVRDTPNENVQRLREFYLRAELWRAAVWGGAGCLVIVIVGCCLEALILHRGWASALLAHLIFVLLAIGLCFSLLSRIRIDDDGISRRILWWWDLWPWDAFADGGVHQGIGRYHYMIPHRPWWKRKIDLSLLDDSDAKDINELVRRVWQPPARGPIPETLTIQRGWPDGRRVVLTSDRVMISKGGQEREYRWRDVTHVVIWRLEADRTDFRELHLRVADQELHLNRRLHQGAEIMNWKGAPSDILAAAVTERVDANRIAEYSLTGACQSLEEVDARFERMQPRLKEARKIQWLPWGMLVPVTGLVFLAQWPKGLIAGILYAPLIYAVRWMVRHQKEALDDELRKYDMERAAFLAKK